MNTFNSLRTTIVELTGKTSGELGLGKSIADNPLTALREKIDGVNDTQVPELLKSINGQSNSNLIFLPEGTLLASAEKITVEYKKQLQYIEEGWEELYEEFECEGRVRAVLFHSGRIPFAWEEGLGYLYVDMIPGPEGKMGQIIYNVNEVDFIVLAESLEELFSKLIEKIEKQQFKFNSNGKQFRIVDKHDQPMNTDRYLEIFNS